MLDFFCSGIQFYVLLSPYLCCIFFLHLDLYVLGGDTFMWSPAGKGLSLGSPVCDVFLCFCHLPIRCPV